MKIDSKNKMKQYMRGDENQFGVIKYQDESEYKGEFVIRK